MENEKFNYKELDSYKGLEKLIYSLNGFAKKYAEEQGRKFDYFDIEILTSNMPSRIHIFFGLYLISKNKDLVLSLQYQFPTHVLDKAVNEKAAWTEIFDDCFRRIDHYIMHNLIFVDQEQELMDSRGRLIMVPALKNIVMRGSLAFKKERVVRGTDAVNLYTEAIERDLIKPERRCGNTTRMVDLAIQLLFEGNKVKVSDHYQFDEGIRHIARSILSRLETEHRVSFKTNLEYDSKTNIMYLKPRENER